MSVKLFTFDWDDVYNATANNSPLCYAGGLLYGFGCSPQSLREPHAAFNQRFVTQFPRLLYTNPSTSYTDSADIRVGSRLSGLGEISGNAKDSDIIAWIEAAAQLSGIRGERHNLVYSAKTIDQLQQGQSLHQSTSTVNSLFTEDGSKEVFDIFKLSAGVTVAAILGIVFLLRR